MILISWLTLSAFAERPTEGGLWSFSDEDEVRSWDEPSGRIRVHYSVAGPNVTKLADTDVSGVPDYVEEVGLDAADVLSKWDELGFRPPVSEADLGLGQLGGSAAFDVYLVDFGGNADGLFGVDACETAPNHCAGYFVMENDFKNYGYPNITTAIRTLTSHELFHAVQAAYDADQPVWFSEGTAVLAERIYDPTSYDFRALVGAYLEDPGRSFDRPPTGPVPAFAYGTGILWDFLVTRQDVDLLLELLEGTETTGDAVDTVAVLEQVLLDRGDSLPEAWQAFVLANAATGDRAGSASYYDYSADVSEVPLEAEGETLDLTQRFYPFAASYFVLEHPGGPLWFGIEVPEAALQFTVFPTDGADGPLELPVAQFDGTPGEIDADLPAGTYFVAGTLPERFDNSVRVRICLGSEALAVSCSPVDDLPDEEEPTEKCGCASTSVSGESASFLVATAALVGRRRYRKPR